MKKFPFLFFILPFSLLLSGMQPIALVQDFAQDPSVDLFAKPGYHQTLKQTLLQTGYDIFCTNLKQRSPSELAGIIFWNIPSPSYLKLNLPKEKLILFTWEPPTTHPELHHAKTWEHFSKIYTWNDDLIDNRKFFKFYYPVLRPIDLDIPPFETRALCTTICGYKTSTHPNELYSERKKIIRFFNGKPKTEFEFYGVGWPDKKYRNYGGTVENKWETLKKYRFSICYENMKNVRGYITEKIFDCFAAGSVPIYLGASNIEEYIPKECFIDRRLFPTDEAVYHFIKKMSKEEHAIYIENIKDFLLSEKAQLFSENQFIETMTQCVNINF